MQVALKRQQAAEDAIALGIRAMATGESRQFLPPGPIIGLSIAMQQSQEHSNAERRIRGQSVSRRNTYTWHRAISKVWDYVTLIWELHHVDHANSDGIATTLGRFIGVRGNFHL